MQLTSLTLKLNTEMSPSQAKELLVMVTLPSSNSNPLPHHNPGIHHG